jgi:Ricin-type beta-trefoil lectin domain-like/Phosphodiester glycosidase/Secretion system C-terminal sorting domain
MKKKILNLRRGARFPACVYLTITSRYLLLCVFFILGLSRSAFAQTNWGTLPVPSSETVLQDLGTFGKIKKAVWSGNNKLEGTEQILHMAELDFSSSGDYELKIAYVYNDPVTNTPVVPAVCKEICYYVTCTGGTECNNGLQRFCEPVAGPQFDFVSHIAAKYGAVMATNGAFYDYFYNCVPGVKSYIKVDGNVVSKPNVLNHRNEGAFAFDFSGATPRMTIAKRSATTLEQLDQNTIYDSDLSSYPNVMSGGHLIQNGQPYVLSMPTFCNGITYPWSSDPAYTGANDVLKKSGAEWRTFACPTIPAAPSQQPDVPITPTAYGYQNFFKCSNLSDLAKRKQFTCVDYAKYGEEFGGSTGLAKRSRTFIGVKGTKFYWFVADGCLDQVTTPGGPALCKGFTIEELGDFAKKLGLDKLLNFDGGSSSAFYLAGKGVLQFQYDPNSAPNVLRVGPQGQRLLESVLMLVPKKKTLSIVYTASTFGGNATINNPTSRSTTQPASYIDLTPSIEKITGRAGVFGKFKTDNLKKPDGTYPQVGQVLFSFVKDEKGPTKEGIIAGIGRMPEELKTIVLNSGRGPGTNGREYDDFLTEITANKLKYWAVALEGGKVVAYDVYPQSYDDRYFRYDAPNPFDGEWHSFMIQGTQYTYDCFTCGLQNPGFESTKFRLFVDGYDGYSSLNDQGTLQNSGIFRPGNSVTSGINTVTVGAMVSQGKYIVGDAVNNDPAQMKLFVQDFLFSRNYDNYYEYSASDISMDKKYGDPKKEFDYYRSQDWNSDTFDELHANQAVGDDGNTVFCFDESAGSRLSYAWYRGTGDPLTRTFKSYGVYMNDASSGNANFIMKRDVQNTKLFERAVYKIVNLADKTRLLSADFTPSTNSGRVAGAANSWAAGTGSANRSNTFLVEQMGAGQFLISKPGLYTLKYGGVNSTTPVITKIDLIPGDPDMYWDIVPALTESTFYIRHKSTGKYMTAGAEEANVTLEDFDPKKNAQVWMLQRTGDAQPVIQSGYYNVKNVTNGNTFVWGVGGGRLYPRKVNGTLPHSDPQYQGVWLDYIGADFYRVQFRYTVNLDNTYLKFTPTTPETLQSPNYMVRSVAGNVTGSDNNIHIKINSTGEVEFDKTLIVDNAIRSFKIHDYYSNTFDETSVSSADWSVGLTSNIPDNGGTAASQDVWSDITYTLEALEGKPAKLTPGNYQLSSLANQGLVGTAISGTQVKAMVDNNNSDDHVWEFEDGGLGKYYISQAGGRYSNIVNGKWVTGAFADRKAMDVVRNPDGSMTLKYNDQCLTDNGNNQEYTFGACTGANNQKFLTYINKHHEFGGLNRGFYKIINKKSSKAVLDNQAGDPADVDVSGYIVQGTYANDADFKDEWLLEPIGNDEYIISNRKSYHLLDVKDASLVDNERLRGYSLNNTKAQRFKLIPTGDGLFQIQNVNSQKYVELNNAGLADGEFFKQFSLRPAGDALRDVQLFSFELLEEAPKPVESDSWYAMSNSIASEAGGAGIFPLTFNNEDNVVYGNFDHVNKSDLWSFLYRGAQLYTIQLKGSGMMLTLGNTALNANNLVQRSLSTAEENSEQLWALTNNYNGTIIPEGSYKIASAKYPAQTLQPGSAVVNGRRAMQLNPAGSNTGNWTLTRVAEPLIDGTFNVEKYDGGSTLFFNTSSNFLLIGGLLNQPNFKFEQQSDGYYKIMYTGSLFNQMVMSATADGTSVERKNWDANDLKQRWSVEYTSTPNQYRIISKQFSTAIWNDLGNFSPVKLVGWADFGDRRYRLTGSGSISSLAASTFAMTMPVAPAIAQKSQLSVYPNPTRGDITVELAFPQEHGTKEYYFELFDMSGKRVYVTRKEVNAGSGTPTRLYNIKASGGVKSGVYILRITSVNGQLLGTKNIVIL